MLEDSARRIVQRVGEHQSVLDVGGWAKPLARADWVIDLQPYDTRGVYEYDRATANERFSAETWVVRDICERTPWPFSDGQFDFVNCAQTLEDVRDPLWVCSELLRVARAGYIEVPSRLEEQSLGADGASWAGWSHHRWLCDVDPAGIRFVHKPHFLHARAGLHFPASFHATLTMDQRIASLWWEGSFSFSERVYVDGAELDAYLSAVVSEHGAAIAGAGRKSPSRALLSRLRGR